MVYETVTTPTNKNLSVRVCCVVTDDVKHLTRCILIQSRYILRCIKLSLSTLGGFLNYEKLVTITTLTAGIGASLLGTTSNAHAEENTQNIQNNAQYNTSNQQSYSTENINVFYFR